MSLNESSAMSTTTPVPSAPRIVRRRYGCLGCLPKVFTLPHTLIGIGFLIYLIAEAACALIGRDVPGRLLDAHPAPKSSRQYEIVVAYDHAGRQHQAKRVVGRFDNDRISPAGTALPTSPVAPPPDSLPLRVHYLAVGPWHYAKVLLGTERSFDDSWPFLFIVPFWNGIVGVFVYQLYVRPWRERRLCRGGVMTAGRITHVVTTHGKGGHHKVQYAFRMEDGSPVGATMKVDGNRAVSRVIGDPVRVLHYPGRAKPSLIYDYCDYTIHPVPPVREESASVMKSAPQSAPHAAPPSRYRIPARSPLIGRLLLPAVRLVAGIAMVCGLLAFLAGFIASTGRLPFVSSDVELPLGDVNSLAVDHQGRIYTSSHFYGRVQEYDRDGRFVCGWFDHDAGGRFQIRMSDDDLLQVVPARHDEVHTYAPDGRRVGSTACPAGTYHDLADAVRHGVRGPDGSVYRIANAIFHPHVTRTDAAGVTTTAVSMAWPNALLNGPFPAWGVFFAGLVILGTTDKGAKSRRKH
jgi:hypothetical protein